MEIEDSTIKATQPKRSSVRKVLKKGVKRASSFGSLLISTPTGLYGSHRRNGDELNAAALSALDAINLMNDDVFSSIARRNAAPTSIDDNLEWSIRARDVYDPNQRPTDDDSMSCASYLISPAPNARGLKMAQMKLSGSATSLVSECSSADGRLEKTVEDPNESVRSTSPTEQMSLDNEQNCDDEYSYDPTGANNPQETTQIKKKEKKSKRRSSLDPYDSSTDSPKKPSSTKKLGKKKGSKRKLFADDDDKNTLDENLATDKKTANTCDSSTATSKKSTSKQKLGKKKGSKRDLFADNGDQNDPDDTSSTKKNPEDAYDSSTELPRKPMSKRKLGKKKGSKRDVFADDDDDNDLDGNNPKSPGSQQPSKNKLGKKRHSKNDLAGEDNDSRNQDESMEDLMSRVNELIDGLASVEPKAPKEVASKASKKHDKASKSLKKQRSKSDLASSVHSASSISSNKSDKVSKSSKKQRSKSELASSVHSASTISSNKSGSKSKKKKKKSKSTGASVDPEESDAEVLDYLNSDPPAFAPDGLYERVYNENNFADSVSPVPMAKKTSQTGDSPEDSNLVMMLMAEITTLEATVSSLQQEREAASMEREQLELQLQQEADDNERLQARVIELECQAKGDHFTSIANDAVHGELVSENESLKEQVQILKDTLGSETESLNDAFQEVSRVQEANQKLKDIVEKQKVLIEMLMDKVQTGQTGAASPKPRPETMQRERPPRRGSLGGLFAASATDGKGDVQRDEGEALPRRGSFGSLFSKASAQGDDGQLVEGEPLPRRGSFGSLFAASAIGGDDEKPDGEGVNEGGLVGGLRSRLRKGGSASNLFATR